MEMRQCEMQLFYGGWLCADVRIHQKKEAMNDGSHMGVMGEVVHMAIFFLFCFVFVVYICFFLEDIKRGIIFLWLPALNPHSLLELSQCTL